MATKKNETEQEAKPLPSEMVIKEIMVQKSVSREEAISILQNPTGGQSTATAEPAKVEAPGKDDLSLNAKSNVLGGVIPERDAANAENSTTTTNDDAANKTNIATSNTTSEANASKNSAGKTNTDAKNGTTSKGTNKGK